MDKARSSLFSLFTPSMPIQVKHTYSPDKDPCQGALDSYLSCVESHKNGLSVNNECGDEVKQYKQCRELQRSSSVTSSKTNKKSE